MWLLTKAGLFDEALHLMDDVIENVPDDEWFAISKAALCFERLDDPHKALDAIDVALERAFCTGSSRREALGVKARILLKLGRGDELGQVLERIMSLKMSREFPDVPRERDFVDAAPPGLVRGDIIARYDVFCPKPSAAISAEPPGWSVDDDDRWIEPEPDGRHYVISPDGEPATPEGLDQMILSHCRADRWRKTAYVIGHAQHDCEDRKLATTDTLIFDRLLHLIDSGAVESRGLLSRWRFSEVRAACR